jgi:hypothetical protein
MGAAQPGTAGGVEPSHLAVHADLDPPPAIRLDGQALAREMYAGVSVAQLSQRTATNRDMRDHLLI